MYRLDSLKLCCAVSVIGILMFANQPVRGQAIVAHRGASGDRLENTLEAFEEAWRQDADAIEGDFYLTKDGKVICYHDRTIVVDQVEHRISDLTFDQLRRIKLRDKRSDRQLQMPSLAEVLKTVPENKQILVEIKCGPEIIPMVKQIIEDSDLPSESIRIIAFDSNVILAAKKAMPEIKAYWLTGFKRDDAGEISPNVASILQTLKACDADGLDCNADLGVIDSGFVKTIRDQDYELHAWTVNDIETAAKLRSLGFDSITTDFPGRLREQLSEKH